MACCETMWWLEDVDVRPGMCAERTGTGPLSGVGIFPERQCEVTEKIQSHV